MQKTRIMQLIGTVMVVFIVLVGAIIYLARAQVITFELAVLMLIALLGIYIGFGILIFVYRLVHKLD